MATTTFKLGDMIVHRIIEMEVGFTPALEFLPKLTPQMLDESRSWMKTPLALDDQDRLVLCFQAYIVRTGKHIILVDSCVGNDKDRPGASAVAHEDGQRVHEGPRRGRLVGERHRFRPLHPSSR